MARAEEIVWLLFLCLYIVNEVNGRVQIMTDKGKPCQIPFVYRSNIHYDCVYEGGKAWCSLTANFDKDREYGWCDATRAPYMDTFGGNAEGAKCHFPFLFRGREYKYCYEETIVPWCATTDSYDRDKKWGYCAGYNGENQFKPFSSAHVGTFSFGDSTALSDNVRQQIVEVHNDIRNKVSPGAANMMKMSYDVDLENIARKWVNQCKGGHPAVNGLPGVSSAGQNVFSSDVLETWKTAITAWLSEVEHFTYGSASSSGTTGHYIQLVWAKSSSVGCAVKICPGGSHHYACNYGPSGNMPPAYKPYIKGRPGSYCKKRDKKYRNLCDCGSGTSCLNGASICPKKCVCKCEEGQVGPRCAIDCDAVKDKYYCKTSYAGKCLKAENVQFACPKMCNICP